jgi:DNA-binding CsgD family transcriptional regulator
MSLIDVDSITEELFLASKILLHSNDLESFFRAVALSSHKYSFTSFTLFQNLGENEALISWHLKNAQLIEEMVNYTDLHSSQQRALVFSEISIFDIVDENDSVTSTLISFPILQGELFSSVTLLGMNKFPSSTISIIKTLANILGIWFKSLPKQRSISTKTLRASQVSKLSKRQQEIFLLMREGQTNLTIAKSLGYSESLIKAESVKIFRTLEISGRQDPLFRSEIL